MSDQPKEESKSAVQISAEDMAREFREAKELRKKQEQEALRARAKVNFLESREKKLKRMEDTKLDQEEKTRAALALKQELREKNEMIKKKFEQEVVRKAERSTQIRYYTKAAKEIVTEAVAEDKKRIGDELRETTKVLKQQQAVQKLERRKLEIAHDMRRQLAERIAISQATVKDEKKRDAAAMKQETQQHLRIVLTETDKRQQKVAESHNRIKATSAGAKSAHEDILMQKRMQNAEMKDSMQRMLKKLVREKEENLMRAYGENDYIRAQTEEALLTARQKIAIEKEQLANDVRESKERIRKQKEDQRVTEMMHIHEQKKEMLQGRRSIRERVAEQEEKTKRLAIERYKARIEEEKRRMEHISPRMKLIQEREEAVLRRMRTAEEYRTMQQTDSQQTTAPPTPKVQTPRHRPSLSQPLAPIRTEAPPPAPVLVPEEAPVETDVYVTVEPPKVESHEGSSDIVGEPGPDAETVATPQDQPISV